MPSLKTNIKRYAPTWVTPALQKIYNKYTEISVIRHDSKSFNAHRLHSLKSATLTQLEAKLTFHAHSIEKGLSHKKLRPNFGKKALNDLSNTLIEFQNKNFNESNPAYLNAISTLNSYITEHEALGVEPTLLKEIFSKDTIQAAISSTDQSGGTLPVLRESKLTNGEKNFEELFSSRVSVREFAPTPISLDRVNPAIELSTKAPSVCNRQAVRVTAINSESEVSKVLRLQGGFNGYTTPPMLLVVTSDLSAFLGPTERNQPFIDGGLFSMALLLALEYHQLAACPLNAMMDARKETSIKTILGIPENERLIMFIAVGEFADEVKAPKSFRYPGAMITSHLDKSTIL